jgi:phenylpropionate dioxygenase-like ring-hydroxylating dioxygenase large terminal subunit
MDFATRCALVQELQRHQSDGTSPLAPSELLNPTRPYYDPEHLQRELKALFRRFPIVVGHASQLSGAGAFLTADLVGLPIVVVRQDDGSVRAFANLCRHRGARVVEEPYGAARSFRCPYHGWIYGTDGALRAITESSAFAGLDRAQRGLIPVPVEQRHGLLWASADSAARLDVGTHLGALDRELTGFGLDAYVEERSVWLRDRLNWKLVVDGFLEAYHLPVLHPRTAGALIHGRPAPFAAQGRHGRMVAARKSFDRHLSTAPEQVDLLPHVAVVYQLFPNSILIWQGDHFELWTVFPDVADPARSSARVSLLAPSAELAESRRGHWDKNWQVLMDTVEHEDFRVGRHIQTGFAAGVQEHVVFGRNEPALQHFHRELRAALESA